MNYSSRIFKGIAIMVGIIFGATYLLYINALLNGQEKHKTIALSVTMLEEEYKPNTSFIHRWIEKNLNQFFPNLNVRKQKVTNVFVLPEYAYKNPQYPTLEDRKEDMINRRGRLLYSIDQIVKAMWLSQGWTVLSETGYTDDEVISEDDSKARAKHSVHLHTIKIESLMPGDVMAVPIPQEQALYRFYVTEVSKTSMGYLTWKGYLEDFANNNEVTLTRGMDLTFASINTPTNSYQLQGFETEGWIKVASNYRR